jgi:hypothetical protein
MSKIVKYLFFFLLAISLTSFFSAGTVFAICPDTCSSVPLPYRCKSPACKDCSECQPEGSSFFGKITKPQGIADYGSLREGGLILFANNLLKLIIGAAGLFAFFNIIIAGYTFMSAGGDAKKVEQAWAKIWQSLLGLLFVAGSFVLAAIFGWLIFGDAGAILVPKIYGP